MAAVGEYFYLHFADEPGLATAQTSRDPGLGKQLRAGGRMADWEMIRVEFSDGLIVDYLANTYAFRLCSSRLRDIIEAGRGKDDVIQWLPTVVTRHDGVDLPYWILHFPEVPMVLNAARSVMAGPMIVKACLDARLVAGHQVLSFPNDSVRLVVASEVKGAIEGAGCSGMKFSKIPVA